MFCRGCDCNVIHRDLLRSRKERGVRQKNEGACRFVNIVVIMEVMVSFVLGVTAANDVQ